MGDSVRPRPLRFEQRRELRSKETDRGRIDVWRLTNSVYASQVVGHLTEAMAGEIIALGEPMYARGTVAGFHHWFGMTSYDTAARTTLTTWVLGHRATSYLAVGLESRLVAMGVSVANLALGNLIRTYPTEAALDEALAMRLEGRDAPATRR